MNLKTLIFESLPKESQMIREVVFMKEQGFVDVVDETDQTAIHLVMYDGDIPIAACRYFFQEDPEIYYVGRFAVMKEYRGKKLGANMLLEVEKQISQKGGKVVKIHSQLGARAFYEKQGYLAFGEIEEEQNCPHIWMKKSL